MKRFTNDGMNITSVVTNDKVKIEIPISTLVTAFEYNPNNNSEVKLKRGKRNLLAEFVAKHIIEECDSETGDTYISNAIDGVFDLILEGFEDAEEFVVECEDYC